MLRYPANLSNEQRKRPVAELLKSFGGQRVVQCFAKIRQLQTRRMECKTPHTSDWCLTGRIAQNDAVSQQSTGTPMKRELKTTISRR